MTLTKPLSWRARFSRAAQSISPQREFRTDEEWESRGILLFKRRLMGFCGTRTVKSVDELASILTELKVADSKGEGRGMVESLDGSDIDYGSGVLHFERVYDRDGKEAYRIVKWNYSLDD